MNATDAKTAAHEAGHCVAAFLLGWVVADVERFRDGKGLTHIDPPTDLIDIIARGEESGVIILAAVLMEASGSGEDHEKLGALAGAGISLGVVYDRTRRLIESEAFRSLHRAVRRELLTRPRLERADLERIFSTASPDEREASSPSARAAALLLPKTIRTVDDA